MMVATIKMGGLPEQEGRSHARHSPHRLRQSRPGSRIRADPGTRRAKPRPGSDRRRIFPDRSQRPAGGQRRLHLPPKPAERHWQRGRRPDPGRRSGRRQCRCRRSRPDAALWPPWAERIVVPAEGLFALPADVDPQQLAMLTINPPTAGLLLSEFVDLAAGDWVVQNAANSGVGRAVIAFAKARGFKTINLVRRTELIDELKALGGDLVIVDAPEGLNLAKDALGAAAPRLAIDGVGGPSAATLINLLGRDGTLVAYSAMGKAPIAISALALIFKRISVRGFFLSDPEHAAKIAPLIVEAAELLRSGRLHAPVAATYPLSAIKDAVAHVQRGGKVLLDVGAS